MSTCCRSLHVNNTHRCSKNNAWPRHNKEHMYLALSKSIQRFLRSLKCKLHINEGQRRIPIAYTMWDKKKKSINEIHQRMQNLQWQFYTQFYMYAKDSHFTKLLINLKPTKNLLQKLWYTSNKTYQLLITSCVPGIRDTKRFSSCLFSGCQLLS